MGICESKSNNQVNLTNNTNKNTNMPGMALTNNTNDLNQPKYSHEKEILYTDAGRYEGDDYRNLLACAIYDFTTEKQQRLTPWLFNKIFRTDVMKEVAKECMHYRIAYAEDSVMLFRFFLKS